MGIYMKIAGVVGPETYVSSKGWFKLQSAQIYRDEHSRGAGNSISLREVIAMKDPDSGPPYLRQQYYQGTPAEVTIAYSRPVDHGPPQEVLRIKLSEAVISSYHILGRGANDSGPVETFTLEYAKLTFERGSQAHASRLVRPEDWGRIQAAAVFNRSVRA